MITEIGLTNFKCFRGENNFPLSRFNLLTGINGKGKSTLLQSLLLMKQTSDYLGQTSYFIDINNNYLILNGSCVQLGEFNDIKNSFASNTEHVKLTFKFIPEYLNFESDVYRSWTFKKMDLIYVLDNNIQDEYTAQIIDYIEYLDDIRELDIKAFYGKFFSRIQFISADRIGPKNFYEIQNINKDFSWVGAKGENTASVLLKKKGIEVNEALYLGADTNTLLQQTEEWLNFIFDGAKININTEEAVISITYNTKQGGERYKPSNVGFGYSYILPIVVAGLIAQSGEILIVENPEAHLHPRAQHKLTQFLAKVAATGVQIFVESHSEHILNALRIIAVNPEFEINNTDLSVLYFQDDDKQPFVQIPVKPNGKIENWPDGFFDQTDKDLDTLISF